MRTVATSTRSLTQRALCAGGAALCLVAVAIPTAAAPHSSVSAIAPVGQGAPPTPESTTVVVVRSAGAAPVIESIPTRDEVAATDLVEHLRGQPDVRSAERAMRLETTGVVSPQAVLPCTDLTGGQVHGGTLMNWQYGTPAPDVTVAIIDTGVDATHPELAGRVLPGMDYISPGADARVDPNGHGTAVAGVVSAIVEPGTSCGVSGMVTSPILPVRAAAADGSSWDYDVASGIIWAADHGADLVNLSSSGPQRSGAIAAAVAYAAANGVVVIAAAGDDSLKGNPAEYPAAEPDVVAVAGTDASGEHSASSGTGPHIDVAAYGEAQPVLAPGGTWASGTGTSFASPHIAGATAAALTRLRSTTPAANGMQAVQQVIAAGNLLYPIGAMPAFGRNDELGSGVPAAIKVTAPAFSGSTSGPNYLLPSPPPSAYTGPADVPSAPYDVSAGSSGFGGSSATVAWRTPLSSGVPPAAIAGYQVTASATGRPDVTCSVDAATSPGNIPQPTCGLTGLIPQTTYDISVTATNTNAATSAAGRTELRTHLAPNVPLAVVVVPGDEHLSVSWEPPAGAGGSALTGYTAMATSVAGTRACNTSPAETTCTIEQLKNGAAYEVAVYAENLVGPSPAALRPNWWAVPAMSWPRPASIVAADGAVRIHSGAPGGSTVMGNLTVVDPTGPGYTTAWPCDQPRPLASVNNYLPDQTIPNFTAIKTDTHGDFCIFTQAGTHLLWDQTITTTSPQAQTPTRKLDTRENK